MKRSSSNYSSDGTTTENFNTDDKYVITGESEFSRDLTIPYDENEVLSERHFTIGENDYEAQRPSYAGIGPKGYKRSDDRIYEEVCEALWRSPQVDPSEIEVSVEHGVVRLQGIVYERNFKRWAERIVDDIAGVKDVVNEIKVEPREPLIINRTGMN